METPVNNFSTTLAAGYTSGSGTCSLTSATGLSGAPNTYTLGIYDQTTGALTVLLRVTALSGTTATVTAEGTDASANSGDIVVAIMSASALNNMGSMQLLKSLTASASASLDFVTRTDGTAIIQSDFTHYVVSIVAMVGSANTTLRLLVSDDGGSTYKTTGYTSFTRYNRFTSGSTGTDYHTTFFRLGDIASSNGLTSGSGELFNPGSAIETFFQADIVGHGSDATAGYSWEHRGRYLGGPITAFQIIPVSGTITSGSAYVYGLRKS